MKGAQTLLCNAIQILGWLAFRSHLRANNGGSLSLNEGEGGVGELQKSPKVHNERSENPETSKNWMALLRSACAGSFVSTNRERKVRRSEWGY